MDEALEEFEHTDLTLLETLDHVLNRGLVIAGQITISVADVDLIFLGLNAVLTSVETAQEVLGARGRIADISESKATNSAELKPTSTDT
jgi:hypothetical protein